MISSHVKRSLLLWLNIKIAPCNAFCKIIYYFIDLVLKNISLVRCAHSWNILQLSKRNFVSPRDHVISSMVVLLVQTPLKSWILQASLRNCKNCVHNCEDHSFTWFHIRSSYMIHFICHFISFHNLLWGRGSGKMSWSGFPSGGAVASTPVSRPQDCVFGA